MSKWHALEGTDFAAGRDGIELTFWPPSQVAAVPRQMADPLSNPVGEDLAPGAWSLLPKGAAWGTPDGAALDVGSNLARFWRAVMDGFAPIYADLWRVAMESSSVSLVGSLADWENEFGLPEACVRVFQSDEARYLWLRQKVTSTGTITPGDFLNLAALLGHSVVIEETVVCEAGFFDCGGPDETGPPEEDWNVVFWVLGANEYGFEAGVGEAGFTPLYDFDQADSVECMFARILPAAYRPIFDYSALTTFSGWPSIWPSYWE